MSLRHLTDSDARELIRLRAKLDGITVGQGLATKHTPGGLVISLTGGRRESPARPATDVTVRITGTGGYGGGKYAGVILGPPAADVATTGTLAVADLGAVPSGSEGECLAVNAAEVGQTSHRITVGAVIPGGRIIRVNGDGKPVVMVHWRPAPLVGVVLAQTGGADGSAAAQPTYTYTAFADGGVVGTNLSPDNRPAAGSYLPASSGIGHWADDGSFVLEWAFETAITYVCPDEP